MRIVPMSSHRVRTLVVGAAGVLLLLGATGAPVSPGDGVGPFDSFNASLGSSGRFVAFESTAGNLVAGDANGQRDVFLRDRKHGLTSLVSVSTAGVQGNQAASNASVSSSGRFVAFMSIADNLVADDTNAAFDVFLRDTKLGTTARVSLTDDDGEANSDCMAPALSANGRFVAFQSFSTNLVAVDANNTYDVFLRDLKHGTTTLVSLADDGSQGNDASTEPAISANGRFVAFRSAATNLVEGDANAKVDIFVRDTKKGTTVRATVSTSGAESSDDCLLPCLSANGRFVAFTTLSAGLVTGDTNGKDDVFVRDIKKSTTVCASVTAAGAPGNLDSIEETLSASGRFVAFRSEATDLVPNDTNSQTDVFVRDLKLGTTERDSLTHDGSEADNFSYGPSLSASGRLLGFASFATQLVPGTDANSSSDIFVRDRKTGAVERESVDPAGGESGGP